MFNCHSIYSDALLFSLHIVCSLIHYCFTEVFHILFLQPYIPTLLHCVHVTVCSTSLLFLNTEVVSNILQLQIMRQWIISCIYLRMQRANSRKWDCCVKRQIHIQFVKYCQICPPRQRVVTFCLLISNIWADLTDTVL